MIIHHTPYEKMTKELTLYKTLYSKLCSRKSLTKVYFYVYNNDYRREIEIYEIHHSDRIEAKSDSGNL